MFKIITMQICSDQNVCKVCISRKNIPLPFNFQFAKVISVNDNSADSPTDEAKLLKQGFLENYKSPYLITDTFLKFRNQGA